MEFPTDEQIANLLNAHRGGDRRAGNEIVRLTQPACDWIRKRSKALESIIADEAETISAIHFGLAKALQSWQPGGGSTWVSWVRQYIHSELHRAAQAASARRATFTEGGDMIDHVAAFTAPRLSTREVAELAGVSARSVSRAVDRGELPQPAGKPASHDAGEALRWAQTRRAS